jgi:methionyl-tRNA synthetase
MDEHKAFLAFLEATTHSLRQAYTARSFSTRRATRALLELVDETRAFAASQSYFAAVPARTNELRTALALELAAARLLALGVAPIMPRFAERLFRGLGGTHPVAEAAWPEGHGWVAEGTAVDLREVGFPAREA